jgi:hypothetical protein
LRSQTLKSWRAARTFTAPEQHAWPLVRHALLCVLVCSFINAFRRKLAARLRLPFAQTEVLRITLRTRRVLHAAVPGADVHPDDDPLSDVAPTTEVDWRHGTVHPRQLETLSLAPGVPRPSGTVILITIELRVTNSRLSSGVINSKGLGAIDVRGMVNTADLFLTAPYMKVHQVVRYGRGGRTFLFVAIVVSDAAAAAARPVPCSGDLFCVVGDTGCGNNICEVGERCEDLLCSNPTACLLDCSIEIKTCPAPPPNTKSDVTKPCGGVGVCLPGTGTCSCFKGYVGDMCERCDNKYQSYRNNSGPCIKVPCRRDLSSDDPCILTLFRC